MHYLTTNPDFPALQAELKQTPWLVACLCAAWCDTCEAYKVLFEQLSLQHPDKCFVWIDIEDQAELVEEIEVENFPTVLIQYEDRVLFLGSITSELSQLNRLINSLQVESIKNIGNSSISTVRKLLENHY